jgi:hypothetical protein
MPVAKRGSAAGNGTTSELNVAVVPTKVNFKFLADVGKVSIEDNTLV